ncbi:MAG: lytic transglycosylase domain-containing protein [Rhizobiaceae bacterium]|nr:lytic transglycosylase domain-containing protein [Rhizobiaceae bacterium]MCV0408045.1 lytic transglycosylase domain-containing protein [Rhizobiaceae bacterium]
MKFRISVLGLAGSLWAQALAGPALGQAALPYAPEPGGANAGRAAIEAELDAGEAPDALPSPELARPGDLERLRTGLDALGKGDLDRARAVRDSVAAGSLDYKLLARAIALSSDKSVTSGEIQRAAVALKAWPEAEALRAAAETAMLRENPEPARVLRAFGDTAPVTIDGAVLLARAQRALGKEEQAIESLRPFWRKTRLSPRRELAVAAEFGTLIPPADHRARMEQMLHHDRIASALRLAPLANAEPLAKAWAAVIRRQAAARKLLDAVPESLRGAGWSFARARYLRWNGEFREAAVAMAGAPTDAGEIVDGDAWWTERRVLARELQDIGEHEMAYEVAAGHAAESPAVIADAEFHAGWFALRELQDAEKAQRHFERIRQVAEGPISTARAEYWLGRAAEALNGDDAAAHFRAAASYPTTFYGQVAAARLGEALSPPPYPEPTPEDRLSFEARETVQAIRRLEAAGHPAWSDRLYLTLAGKLDSAGELALLAVMAEERGDHRLALRVGKAAAARGLEIGALAHPVGAIPADARISEAGEALAYAVARQESEFNHAAVSGAGARGLLQLLPGTARDMARKTGMEFAPARLTSDAGYNAALGAAYLAEQLDRFAGSYILTFIGYNAGPRRASDWMTRYGDPRGMSLDDVVDWVERIPFTETRNYVQRVMENYQVYKMRLSDRFEMAADLTTGRRSDRD